MQHFFPKKKLFRLQFYFCLHNVVLDIQKLPNFIFSE